MTTLTLIFVMLLVGLLLGFIGAGGSGFIIAILTTGFGYPVHIAMGVALAAMLFTSLSGMISQQRQRNTDTTAGLWVGLTGAVGSIFGSRIAFLIAPEQITWFTASMLVLSSLLMWLRLTLVKQAQPLSLQRGSTGYILRAVGLGLAVGLLTGAFGIGCTPFIQLGLILLLGLDLRKAAGTSMLVILPIAAAGWLGYYQGGGFDALLLLKVLAGTMVGSYIGARFTKYAPARLLKTGVIVMPITAACVLVL